MQCEICGNWAGEYREICPRCWNPGSITEYADAIETIKAADLTPENIKELRQLIYLKEVI